MYAHLAFFHQGYDLFSELGPYMKDLGAQVTSWLDFLILGCLSACVFLKIFIILGIWLLTYLQGVWHWSTFTCGLKVEPELNLKVTMPVLNIDMRVLKERLKGTLLAGAVHSCGRSAWKGGWGKLRYTSTFLYYKWRDLALYFYLRHFFFHFQKFILATWVMKVLES